MQSVSKLNKQLIREISSSLAKPVKEDGGILLYENSEIEAFINMRCIPDSNNALCYLIEVTFGVSVKKVLDLWACYLDRPVANQPVTLALQIRSAAFPGRNLPEWAFSLQYGDKNAELAFKNCICCIVVEELIPLAQKFETLGAIINVVEARDMPLHMIDRALLFFAAGEFKVAKDYIDTVRAKQLSSESAAPLPMLVQNIFDKLEVDIKNKCQLQ